MHHARLPNVLDLDLILGDGVEIHFTKFRSFHTDTWPLSYCPHLFGGKAWKPSVISVLNEFDVEVQLDDTDTVAVDIHLPAMPQLSKPLKRHAHRREAVRAAVLQEVNLCSGIFQCLNFSVQRSPNRTIRDRPEVFLGIWHWERCRTVYELLLQSTV